jgi:Tol biopolymer transport system component
MIEAKPMRFLVGAVLVLFHTAVVTTVIHAAQVWLPAEIIAFSASGRTSQDIFIQDVSRGIVRNLTGFTGSHHDTQPSWSPDGFQIVFAATADSFAPNDLYVIGIDGSGLRQLTDWVGTDFNPTWSPDGRHIAFVSSRTNKIEIYVMDAMGNNLRQLTDNSRLGPGYVINPTWSPDGTVIAYYSMRPEHAGIYVVAADGGSERFLVGSGNPSFTWSPDGSQIAFLSVNDTIDLLDVDSGRRTPLKIPGVQTALAWLPDRNQIIFVSQRCNCAPEFYVLDLANGQERRFTRGPSDSYLLPAWRPS